MTHILPLLSGRKEVVTGQKKKFRVYDSDPLKFIKIFGPGIENEPLIGWDGSLSSNGTVVWVLRALDLHKWSPLINTSVLVCEVTNT